MVRNEAASKWYYVYTKLHKNLSVG